ncbi:putative thymidylate kinase [Vibrio phage vB_VpaS_KF4]|nr:putative thymidylate kinase [Vibrio phage vB_VpaS_KF3]ATI19284.1 putative thymidylate kinase [Vibrio phage vB_VpaS_KF4]AVI05171.1 thymidylate kinase [Vibrio phage VP06]
MSRGVIVAIEGFDGSGKSTLAKMLVEELSKYEVRVVPTRQPGGTPYAEDIRSLLMSGDRNRSQQVEAHLFLAARHDLHDKLIKPESEAGAIVVCDRHYLSSLANQPECHDLFLENRVFDPDVWIMARCPFPVCITRSEQRGDDDAFSNDELSEKRAQYDRYQYGIKEVLQFAASDSVFTIDTDLGLNSTREQIQKVASYLVSLNKQLPYNS